MRILDCPQHSPEWYQARLGKVTASCFSKALAGGQGKTRASYMLQLVAERLTGEPQDTYTNAAMERGSEVEPAAREYYQLAEDISIEQIGFIEHDDNIGASPDALVGTDGLVEIKCPNSTTHITYILEDRLPPTYKAQVQGQLWVAERQWCDFVSYDPRMRSRQYFCVRVYRDEEYIKELATGLYGFVADLQELMDRLTADTF
jgi:putative phage-type endonuclease